MLQKCESVIVFSCYKLWVSHLNKMVCGGVCVCVCLWKKLELWAGNEYGLCMPIGCNIA